MSQTTSIGLKVPLQFCTEKDTFVKLKLEEGPQARRSRYA